MRRALLAVPLAAAACHGSGDWTGSSDRDVHMAMDGNASSGSVSVNLPGVDARIALPRLDLGKHVDLDGIHLAPGTKVRSLDVHDQADGRPGTNLVALHFTSPLSPGALADYYRGEAATAGFGAVAGDGGGLTATKGHKRFALTAAPAGGGSAGTIDLTEVN